MHSMNQPTQEVLSLSNLINRNFAFLSFDKEWDKLQIDEHSKEIENLIDWGLNV